jgi:hypothetical protein
LRITMMSTTSYFMKLMSINLDRLKFPEDNWASKQFLAMSSQ